MTTFEILLSGQLLFSTLFLGSIYALIALGLNIVYATVRLLNVAHGDLVVIGAYVTYCLFVLTHGASPLLFLPVTALCGIALALVIYRVFVRALIKQAGRDRLESNSLLVFFGLSILIQNSLAMLFGATPRGFEYLSTIIFVNDVAITASRLVSMICAISICLGLMLFFHFHRVGLAIRAVSERQQAAALVGIRIASIQKISLMIGFSSATLAGLLVSMTGPVSPFSGFSLTIAAFVIAVLGGLGNLAAGMVAAMLLAAIETYGIAITSTSLRSVLLYGTFILALIAFPKGLLARRAIR